MLLAFTCFSVSLRMCDIRHRQLRKYTGRKVAECMSRSMEDTVYDHVFTTRMILSAVDSMQRVMKVGFGQVCAPMYVFAE